METIQEQLNSFAHEVMTDIGLRAFDLHATKLNDIKIQMLAVHKNELKQGKGTQAMERLTAFADQKGMRIVLLTGAKDKDWGTTSMARLKRFYKRFGFVANKGKDYRISENMLRHAQ